jgi:hypothetical protein
VEANGHVDLGQGNLPLDVGPVLEVGLEIGSGERHCGEMEREREKGRRRKRPG